MANSYHYHQQIISRGDGRSAVAAAAYRSGERLLDETDRRTKRFGDPSRVVASGVELPASMPARMADREALWNSVELFERRADAQLAREHEMSIPRDLPHGERIELARSFAAELAREGRAADWAVHADRDGGGYHVHIMETLRGWDASRDSWAAKRVTEYLVRDRDGREDYMRPAELRERAGEGWEKTYQYRTEGGRMELTRSQADGLGLTNADRVARQAVSRSVDDDWGDRRERIGEMRERWERMANDALREHYDRGHVRDEEREYVDSRSYQERDRDLEEDMRRRPTSHMGPDRTEIERSERDRCEREGREYVPVTEMGRENESIREANRVREALRRAMGRLRDALRGKADLRADRDRADRRAGERARSEGLRDRDNRRGPRDVSVRRVESRLDRDADLRGRQLRAIERGDRRERNRLDREIGKNARKMERDLRRVEPGRERDRLDSLIQERFERRGDRRRLDMRERERERDARLDRARDERDDRDRGGRDRYGELSERRGGGKDEREDRDRDDQDREVGQEGHGRYDDWEDYLYGRGR